ncbi:GNAT family N-acetyltransferase [bacterium]|jgi:hypothetical protein|nr:GNAT family N-acetyltransferase [bacterium]
MVSERDSLNLEFVTGAVKSQKELSSLALRSKGLWGYDPSFLELCQKELQVPLHSLEAGLVQIGYRSSKMIGFYSFTLEETEPGLNFLFIEPEEASKGYGRILFEKCVSDARSRDWLSFLICSDPHAQPFYEHMGALFIGNLESPVQQGRLLPVLRYIL